MAAGLLIAAGVVAVPDICTAQELSLSFGVDLLSDYISDGESQTAGQPSIQPWIEVEHDGGAYFALWGATLDDGSLDSFEFDLSAGFRHEVGAIGIDLGFSAGFLNLSGFDGSDVSVAFSYAFGDAEPGGLELEAEISSDVFGIFGHAFGATYLLPGEGWLAADLDLEETGFRSWSIGLGQPLSDHAALEIRYHDSDATRPRVTVGLSLFR